MELELVTDGLPEDENYAIDENFEELSTFESERCGICMDVLIDRGVLDCCQHWFCFTCIDNWATVTNLCPLCQIEFHLITCVPHLPIDFYTSNGLLQKARMTMKGLLHVQDVTFKFCNGCNTQYPSSAGASPN